VAISAKYVLVCDEVRQENNGKFIIVGLYTPDLVVPQIPTVLPALTFFVGLDSDRPQNCQFRINLQHLETGQVVAQAMGGFTIQRPGLGPVPIRFGNLQLNAQGAYLFNLQIDGEREPITASFSVNLAVAQQGQQVFPLPPMR
jgi:hypothetical protein